MAQSRTKRNSQSPFRFNRNRDPEILVALGKMQFLRTRDITRLYFGSKVTAKKRLRRLFDAGLVNCWSQDLFVDNIYSLSSRGKALLVQDLGLSGEEFRIPSKIKHVNLDHRFGINSFRISLALAAQRNPGVELGFFKPEQELKGIQIPNLLPLLPDAIFMLRDLRSGSGRKHFFSFEYDLAGENPSYWVKYKIQRYLEILEGGFLFYGMNRFRIVVVVPSARRLRSLGKAAFRAGARVDFLLAVESQLSEDTVFTRTFYYPDEEIDMDDDDAVALV